MSSRVLELFLFDIIIAISKIEDTIKEFDSGEDLLYSYRDWDSVIREFEIIGEATKHLIDGGILDFEQRKIVDFRNIIAHKYFGIDADAVMTIANNLNDFKYLIVSKIKNTQESLKLELIEMLKIENKHLNFAMEALEQLR